MDIKKVKINNVKYKNEYKDLTEVKECMTIKQYKKILYWIKNHKAKDVLILCGNGLGKSLTKKFLEKQYEIRGSIITTQNIISTDEADIVIFNKI